MISDKEQFKLLRETSSDIEEVVQRAYEQMIKDIRAGMAPVEAVEKAMQSFSGEFAKIMAAGLSVVIGEAISSGSVLSYEIGQISLSSRIYAQTQKTATTVQSVVTRHTKGFQDARALALELYEGYDFRPEEVLNIKKTNPTLPQYLRELLKDPATANELSRAYAKAQARALKTDALRAAYNELLRSIDDTEAGAGMDYLQKKLRVAFEEKTRYYAKRIAQTELHRAYAEAQAREIMADEDVNFVQWRLNPAHPVEDICDYFAGVDRYGLGPGVYPKAEAPVAPAHPFCKCVLSKMFISGDDVERVEDAEAKYFATLRPDEARKVAGSEAKLERVKAGETAWQVHNSGVDPIYQVKTVGETV